MGRVSAIYRGVFAGVGEALRGWRSCRLVRFLPPPLPNYAASARRFAVAELGSVGGRSERWAPAWREFRSVPKPIVLTLKTVHAPSFKRQSCGVRRIAWLSNHKKRRKTL